MDKYRIATDWEKARVRTGSDNKIGEAGATALGNLMNPIGAAVFLSAPGILGGMTRGARRLFGKTQSMASKVVNRGGMGR